MKLGDIATGKLDDCDITIADAIRMDQDSSAGFNCLVQRRTHVRHFISSRLSPVGVWQMPIAHEHHDLAESRLDRDSSEGFVGPADFDPWGALVVRHDLALREPGKVANERVGPFR